MKIFTKEVLLIFIAPMFGFLFACQSTAIRTFGPVVSPGVVFHFECDQKFVALTLDDGPDKQSTLALLDVLTDNDATATFFVLGEKATPELLQILTDAGHELGNHGMNEQVLTQLNSVDVKQHIDTAAATLEAHQTVKWFRPAKGRLNDDIRFHAEQKGYSIVLADVFPYDHWIASSRVHRAYIRASVKPGSIIVLHEGGKRGERTVRTLQKLLPWLRAKGFTVRSLSDMQAEGGCAL